MPKLPTSSSPSSSQNPPANRALASPPDNLPALPVSLPRTYPRPPALAVVGTRKPTAYGRKIAYELAYAAAKRGIIIISGLAFGIDSIAHRAALDAGGTTVAILGTPIDYIYPHAHYSLAEEIIQTGGCILSELPPGAVEGRDYHWRTCFLERNRLISGLADIVVIPEATEHSGSLNTAAHALEQGREVFATPGDITHPTSTGCNRLIASGATPYLEPSDILDRFFPPIKRRSSTPVTGDTPEETAVLKLLSQGETNGETLLSKSSLPAHLFNQTLTMLELKGRISPLGYNNWSLKS